MRGLLLAILLLPSIALGQLSREPSGHVVLQSGRTALRFFPEFGGTPLEWWRQGFPLLTNSYPGSGASVAWRSTQDPTQASSDGMTGNPIARIGHPPSAKFGYYGRETVFDTRRQIYEVTGFAPDFWLSTEAIDDAIAPNADGSDTGWRTPYDPGLLAATLDLPVRPIVFQGELWNQSGLLFIGDEANDASPWAQRLRRYEGGRVAFKITLSLAAAAPEAFAGVVFRADVPAAAQTKHDAYAAPGIYLLANRQGRWQLVRHNPDGTHSMTGGGALSPVQRAKLESPTGLQLEVRTHNALPGYVEVWLDDILVAKVQDELRLSGPHVGLFASTPWGRVFFQSRAVYDVGVEYVARYSTWEGGIVSDVTVRNAVGALSPHAFDRANLPAVFLHPETFPEGGRMIAEISPYGQVWPLVPWSYPLAGAFAWWAGNREGTAGVACVPEVFTVDGRQVDGAHVFLKEKTEGNEFVMMLNPLPPDAVTEARELRFRARWFTALDEVH